MIPGHEIDPLRGDQAVERRDQCLQIPVGPVKQVAGDQHHGGILRVDFGHDAREEVRAQDLPQMHVGKVHQCLALPTGREVLDADAETHQARMVGRWQHHRQSTEAQAPRRPIRTKRGWGYSGEF